MTIAWDCFDRTTNALVARSAIDVTSPAISCLQAAGSISSDPGSDLGFSQEPGPDANGCTDTEPTDPEPAPAPSTGDALGNALGKLLGQGIADLFHQLPHEEPPQLGFATAGGRSRLLRSIRPSGAHW